jgi:uncharacterized OB-fold protein
MITEKFILPPQPDQDSKPYWEYLHEHKAHLQKCRKCGRFRFPPNPSCPHCGTLGGDWTPISGRGKVYSWIVIRHPVDPRLATEVPFTVALVELEEGVRMIGRLAGLDQSQVTAGMPVKARYDDIDNAFTLVNFEPVA